MSVYAKKFMKLVKKYKGVEVEFPALKGISIAQWILESGRGTSGLAKLHNNFAGMKWRTEMMPFAKRVLFDAPSERAYFCHFHDLTNFIDGYWAFLDRPPYDGWRNHTADPYDFIEFIGPIWATDASYVDKVSDLLAEAENLLGEAVVVDHEVDADDDDAPCCGGRLGGDSVPLKAATSKPSMEFIASPYHWSRAGVPIEYIVIHYTTSRSINGTISWFQDNPRSLSTHYIVGRSGRTVQMVKDKRRCIHANSKNPNSIGIEHSAAAGDRITVKQETASLALIRWLMDKHSIPMENVICHKCAPRNTPCPGDLFLDYGADRNSNCAQHQAALQAWLTAKL